MAGLAKAPVAYKAYQTMIRIVKESDYVDARPHCFLLQLAGREPHYLNFETRQELIRMENSWTASVATSVVKLGVSIIIFFKFISNNFHLVFICLFCL